MIWLGGLIIFLKESLLWLTFRTQSPTTSVSFDRYSIAYARATLTARLLALIRGQVSELPKKGNTNLGPPHQRE